MVVHPDGSFWFTLTNIFLSKGLSKVDCGDIIFYVSRRTRSVRSNFLTKGTTQVTVGRLESISPFILVVPYLEHYCTMKQWKTRATLRAKYKVNNPLWGQTLFMKMNIYIEMLCCSRTTLFVLFVHFGIFSQLSPLILPYTLIMGASREKANWKVFLEPLSIIATLSLLSISPL